MRTLATSLAISALCMALPGSRVEAQGRDSAAFVIRLGLDTTAVERYVRTGQRIDAVSVSRSPRTVVRRFSVWLGADGSVARFAAGPGSGDMRETATPAGIPLVGGFWLPWELALQKAFTAEADSTNVTMLSGSRPVDIPFHRLASDRYAFANQFDQPIQARTDRAGLLQYLEIQGGGATVERVGWLDIDAFARDFSARDEAGSGLGSLSPFDSVATTIAGAGIRVRYNRPALRGRDMRTLVPFGQVWRTGANNATEFHTDRNLRFGDLSLAAGSYSLFTIPRAGGWTLIINRQIGMSGLARDPGQDLGQIEMEVRDIPFTDRFTILVEPAGAGGVLRLRWGGSEAVATFTVGG